MSGTSSAYPDRLMNYSNIAGPDNSRLSTSARDASNAIQAFLRSNPDPSVMPPIQDVGAEVAAYAQRKAATDQWVFDVGLAFLTIAQQQAPAVSQGSGAPPLLPDWGSQQVTATDGQLQRQLTNNALTDEATKDGKALRDLMQFSSFPGNNKDKLEQLLHNMSVYADDPVQLAAFFKALGTNGTLEVAHYIQQLRLPPGTLAMFDNALATASYSPTWDNTWASNLVKDAGQPDPMMPGPEGIGSNRYEDLSLLLQSGIFSTPFLTQVGDQYLYRSGPPLAVNPTDAAVPAFFQALARNPDAAYSYLTGVAPYQGQFPFANGLHTGTADASSPRLDGQQSRLSELELLLRSRPPGTTAWSAPSSWMSALAQAAIAADAAPGAPPNAGQTLLSDMATDDWQSVPDPFRNAVTQLVARNLNLFNENSPLSEKERFDLVALATNNGDGTPDQARIADLKGAIVTYVIQLLPGYVQSGRLRDWETIVGWLSAIPAAGETIGAYSHQKDVEQQKEATDIALGILVTVGSAFLPELEAGEGVAAGLGLSAGEVKALNILFDVGKDRVTDTGKQDLLKVFYPGGEPAGWTEQDRALANVELLSASLLYAKDPSFLPNRPDPATAKKEIALAVQYATQEGGTEQFIAAVQQQCGVTLSQDQASHLLDSVDQPWVFYTKDFLNAQAQAQKQYGGA